MDILMEQGACSLTDISKRLGVHKSTVLRLLTMLRERGVVEHDEDRQKYRLGLRVIEHGRRVAYDHKLLRASFYHLERLRDTSGETTNLTALQQGRLILITSGPRDRFGLYWGRGMAHSTASGKAILAHLSDEEVENIYNTVGFPALTDHTITDLQAMREDLRLTRERGYSFEENENQKGALCIGSPIFGPGGKVEGAISIAGPVSRFTEEVYLPLVPVLQVATFEISLSIGADNIAMAALTPPKVELPAMVSSTDG